MLEYTRSQSNKTVQHASVREFSKQSPTASRLGMAQKIQSERLFVLEKRMRKERKKKNVLCS